MQRLWSEGLRSAKRWWRAFGGTPPWTGPDLIPAAWRGANRGYRRFVVLTHARSGSTLLSLTLDTHPEIVGYRELLHPQSLWVRENQYADTPWRPWRDAHPMAFVRDVVFGGYADHLRAVGFKLFPEHLDRSPQTAGLWTWLAGQQDIAIISLHRENLLACFLSLTIAQQEQRWLAHTPEQRSQAVPSLDPEKAEKFFERQLRDRASVRERFAQRPRFMEITYEQLDADLTGTLDRVQGLLGVQKRPLQAAILKQETRPLSQAIANYEELVARWRGTRWEAFLV